MHFAQRPIVSIIDERVELERGVLRIFVRSATEFFRVTLRNNADLEAKTAPLLRFGDEYSAALALHDAQTNDTLRVVLQAPDGSEVTFGQRMAEHIEKLENLTGRSRTAQRGTKIVGGVLRQSGGVRYVSIYADWATHELYVRISGVDDIDAFLSATEQAIEAKPDHLKFSVVSAVYNVEKYLDEYLSSMVAQTVGFRSRIELILVNDGSADRSAKVIKRWQRKYPKNIHYLHHTSNVGLSAARNLGLQHAGYDWITFIDPDDFIERDYFERVSNALRGDARIGMVACNVINFDEATRTRRDTHVLRYRFANGSRLVSASDLGRDIQNRVNAAFFMKQIIDDHQLRFDERIRPNFEDGHFAARYALRVPDKLVAFLPDARYLYRRRADSSSLVQTGPSHPEMYGDQIEYGYLGLARDAIQQRGYLPSFVQNMIFYSLSWQFQRVVDHPQTLDFLGKPARQRYLRLLTEVFSKMDLQTITGYDLTPIPFIHRVGILNLFRNIDPPFQVAEILEFDPTKLLAKVCYWTRHSEPSAKISLNDIPVEPAFHKSRRSDFAGQAFAWEHINWVRLDLNDTLRVFVGAQEASISVMGGKAQRGIRGTFISEAFRRQPLIERGAPNVVKELRRLARSPSATAAFDKAWLFMDRDTEADDSGEHLYRFVRKRRPDINAFFVLQRGVPHWHRLKADGFNLLAFNEPEHALALLNASHLISSQADHYVGEYLDRKFFGDLLSFKFTYLRHGVSKDDTSAWLNRKKIDCLVASTRDEYESIAGDRSPYKFTKKEVVLTGLPRHDEMLRGRGGNSRGLVIMPTWRQSLTGKALGPGNARAVSSKFYESDFAHRWKRLLHSSRLAELAERRGHDLVFVPHPNLQQYLEYFDLPDTIKTRRFSDAESIQSVFQDCALFVTDYSSKAFDMAYLGKPVVYYQFDPDVFFGGGHTGSAGYFDYVRDGFGPVVREEVDVLGAIETIINGAGPNPVYERRASSTFTFRDGRNCERVLQAILAMDEPVAQFTLDKTG